MRIWIVEWKVSGTTNKETFNDYNEAKKYLIETLETFGRDWYIEIKLKESFK